MNGEKEYTNDMQPICVIIIFFYEKENISNKRTKTTNARPTYYQFIPCGPIKVIKYSLLYQNIF